ncbi:MAG TPA: sigma factor-like helix-turn-helix DNA-binding protein [Kribbella sp.]
MSASEREQGDGGQPAPLQPASPPACGDNAAAGIEPLSGDEVAEGLRARSDRLPPVLRAEAEEARRAEERLERRLADRDLIDRLARDDFQGLEYEKFEDALTEYGLPVLRAWMYTGYIFVLTARRGWPLYPTELELDHLRSDSDLRGDLAADTLVKALPFFRKNALVNGHWSVEGGANLTTYFTGACAQMFPNEFRRDRRERQRLNRFELEENQQLDTSVAASDDPSHIVVGDQWVLAILAALPPKHRHVVELSLAGYSHIEIGEMLEMTARAVEGVLYRFRKTMQERSER